MSLQPSSATKQARISRPRSVRMGMFWRLGFWLESRPVAAATWLKVVRSRPSSPSSDGNASR